MKRLIILLLLAITVACNGQDLIKVYFSEPMDSAGLFNPENYEIEKTYVLSSVIPMGLTYVWAPPVVSVLKPAELPYDSLVYIYCMTEEHYDGEYIIYVNNVFDLAGNEINDTLNFAEYVK